MLTSKQTNLKPLLESKNGIHLTAYLVNRGDLIDLKSQLRTTMDVGSASYIAAPAAIRSSIPTANPSLYLALPLAVTFPMNLILGIPFYIYLAKMF